MTNNDEDSVNNPNRPPSYQVQSKRPLPNISNRYSSAYSIRSGSHKPLGGIDSRKKSAKSGRYKDDLNDDENIYDNQSNEGASDDSDFENKEKLTDNNSASKYDLDTVLRYLEEGYYLR